MLRSTSAMDRVSNQLVQLGDSLADPGAELLVAAVILRLVGKRPLDPGQRPFRPLECRIETAVVHIALLGHRPIVGKRLAELTMNDSPPKGRARTARRFRHAASP